MTDEIAPAIFADDNALLRIWFDDGVNGLQALTPDHKLTSSAYSHRASSVDARYVLRAQSGNVVNATSGTPSYQVTFAESLDPSSSYDGVSTFTAPVSGYYFCATNITFSNGSKNGTDAFEYMFKVNGVTVLSNHFDANSNTFTGQPLTQSTSGVLLLQQGDTVQVWLEGVGSDFIFQNRNFSVFLIGQ